VNQNQVERKYPDLWKLYETGREFVDDLQFHQALRVFITLIENLFQRREAVAAGHASEPAPDELQHLLIASLLGAAFCYAEMGRFEQAFTILNRALAVDPENPDVLSEIAYLHNRKGLRDEAIGYLKRAIEVAPADPRLLKNLATIYLDADRVEEAIRELRLAVKLDPDFDAVKVQFYLWTVGVAPQAVEIKTIALVPLSQIFFAEFLITLPASQVTAKLKCSP